MIDNNESILDYYTRKIPEYYDTMYLDGFTPMEILQAKHKEMSQEYIKKNHKKKSKKVLDLEVKINGQRIKP